jgi:hypothetical protein
VVGFQMLESALSAAGTYVADVKLPAYACLLDVVVHAEEVWNAGTSAVLDCGLYTVDSEGVISSEEDLNGIYAAIDMLATDLTKGQSLTFNRAGGKGGAMLTEGTSTHLLDIVGDTDRIVQTIITTTGTVGTLGETYVYVIYAIPELDASVNVLT